MGLMGMWTSMSAQEQRSCKRMLKVKSAAELAIIQNKEITMLNQRTRNHFCKDFRKATATDRAIIVMKNQAIFDKLAVTGTSSTSVIEYSQLSRDESDQRDILSQVATSLTAIMARVVVSLPNGAAASRSVLSGNPGQTNIDPTKYTNGLTKLCQCTIPALVQVCNLQTSQTWAPAWNNWNNQVAQLPAGNDVRNALNSMNLQDTELASLFVQGAASCLTWTKTTDLIGVKFPRNVMETEQAKQLRLSGVTAESFVEAELNKEGMSLLKLIMCVTVPNSTVLYENISIPTNTDGIPMAPYVIVPTYDTEEAEFCMNNSVK